MEDNLKKLVTVVEELNSQIAFLVADRAAAATVIRALAEANAHNPVFLAALKNQAEIRNVGQLNSTMKDGQIEAFRSALHSLLPQQLRDI
ncbi:hypothetical protein LGN19_05960 [Burkholderia sp. AU30198]|uniref:hypothetical protein n=1 Tax=unclassified Burkholderia TaxID=2613784 RepID=UPI00196442DB|nr:MULTISPECIES: hypothetical protein [unclassified Burkholderia]MCA8293336.1 hypothetical protein [Burkholderia sp. AU30198]